MEFLIQTLFGIWMDTTSSQVYLHDAMLMLLLGRWRIVTHGAVDGYSRLIVFLQCSNNNRSSTVLSYFLEVYSCMDYIRTDRGGENVQVLLYKIIVHIFIFNPLMSIGC